MKNNKLTWEGIWEIVREAQKHPERMIPFNLDDETPDPEAEG